MERWINLAGYQLVWLSSVLGAAHGKSWPAWTASSLLCGGHLIGSSDRGRDLQLIATAAVLGTFLDGFLASSGLLSYAPAVPSVPVSGCPLWILALWLAFSTTLTRSLAWLQGRTGWTLLFGAAGGPLAYWAAARGWSVITFSTPQWQSFLALGAGWAITLAILVSIAGRTTSINSHARPCHGEPVP